MDAKQENRPRVWVHGGSTLAIFMVVAVLTLGVATGAFIASAYSAKLAADVHHELDHINSILKVVVHRQNQLEPDLRRALAILEGDSQLQRGRSTVANLMPLNYTVANDTLDRVHTVLLQFSNVTTGALVSTHKGTVHAMTRVGGGDRSGDIIVSTHNGYIRLPGLARISGGAGNKPTISLDLLNAAGIDVEDLPVLRRRRTLAGGADSSSNPTTGGAMADGSTRFLNSYVDQTKECADCAEMKHFNVNVLAAAHS